MSKTILCAVDIQDRGDDEAVLARAKQIADLDGAQLDVITVVPDFGASVVGAYFQDHDVKTARDGAEKLLHAYVDKVLGAAANTQVRHVVGIGSVYEQVLKTAKLSGADLIVIGASRPELRDYLLGPNASRVVRHSDCSVYVVR